MDLKLKKQITDEESVSNQQKLKKTNAMHTKETKKYSNHLLT